jgi:hypothetical protein
MYVSIAVGFHLSMKNVSQGGFSAASEVGSVRYGGISPAREVGSSSFLDVLRDPFDWDSYPILHDPPPPAIGGFFAPLILSMKRPKLKLRCRSCFISLRMIC